MKKISLILFLLVFTLISITPVSGYEQGKLSKEKVIYQKDEIKDLKKLERMALNGISDLKENPFTINSTIKEIDLDSPEKNKERKNIKTVQTTQKLKEVELENGEIITDYSTTVFTTNATYSKTGSVTDPTISWRARATIHWSEKTENGIRYYKLNSTNGSWEQLDSQVFISNRLVRYGQVGPGCTATCTREARPTSNTFSYTAPSSWPWVAKGTGYNLLGVNTFADLTRGSSKWILELHVQDL